MPEASSSLLKYVAEEQVVEYIEKVKSSPLSDVAKANVEQWLTEEKFAVCLDKLKLLIDGDECKDKQKLLC